jgi:hypothetical protein
LWRFGFYFFPPDENHKGKPRNPDAKKTRREAGLVQWRRLRRLGQIAGQITNEIKDQGAGGFS